MVIIQGVRSLCHGGYSNQVLDPKGGTLIASTIASKIEMSSEATSETSHPRTICDTSGGVVLHLEPQGVARQLRGGMLNKSFRIEAV